MDQVLKNKVWTTILAILFIANVGTLAGFWYIKLHGNNAANGPGGRPDASGFIIKQLNFNADQQAKYKQLIIEHQQDINQIQPQLHHAKDAFFSSIGQPVVPQAKLDSLSSAIGDYEKQLDMLTYQHFKKVRALCDAEQKAKFDQIIAQVMRMMGPMPGGRPQGPPPPRGDGGNYPPPPDGQGPLPGQGPPPQ